MTTYKEKIDLRKQGLTNKEIAEKLGLSRQTVGQILATYNPSYFRHFDEKGCIYKGLREWLNKNKVSRTELIRRTGYLPHTTKIERLSLCLKGEVEFKKCEIDDILAITGLTYEQAFEVG
jgi:transposase